MFHHDEKESISIFQPYTSPIKDLNNLKPSLAVSPMKEELQQVEDSKLYMLKGLRQEIEEEEKALEFDDDLKSKTFSNHDLTLSRVFKQSQKELKKPSVIVGTTNKHVNFRTDLVSNAGKRLFTYQIPEHDQEVNDDYTPVGYQDQ